MSAPKTAIIIGATGLIGSYLLEELKESDDFSQIKILTRRPTGAEDSKTVEFITDFQNKDQLKKILTGDVIFCCIGTTIKTAGSQEAFRKVDLDIPVLTGKIGKENGIEKMLVVSSLGADDKSSNFYLRTKGEMENALIALNFRSLTILRPSMLLGPRKESRPAETAGKLLMLGLGWLFVGKLSKYKGINAYTVAKAMVKIANSNEAPLVIESDKIESVIK